MSIERYKALTEGPELGTTVIHRSHEVKAIIKNEQKATRRQAKSFSVTGIVCQAFKAQISGYNIAALVSETPIYNVLFRTMPNHALYSYSNKVH